MKSSKRSYKKHHVKRNPQTLQLLEENGKPVVGEFIRNARITEETADVLNSNSMTSGHMWVGVKESTKKDEKSPDKDEKAELTAELKKLFDEGKLEKMPHPATGIAKLTELLTSLKEK